MYIKLITGEVYYTTYIKTIKGNYIQFTPRDKDTALNIHIDNVIDIQKNNPNA
jgi:hypothetical protein